tara:strand:+ start:246 stop:503 length:258 start_codon:yes stop_codon:yes gene_type:complete
MVVRREYRSLRSLNRGVGGQIKRGEREKINNRMMAGLTNQQMIKAIKGGFYSGDLEGFLEDMQILRDRGETIKQYYDFLKTKKYI